MNGEASAAIDKFLSEEHTFEEYCEYIEKFRNVASEISSLNSIVNFDMVSRVGNRYLTQTYDVISLNQVFMHW